ncbi:ABC transporter substrate-binding protein [Paenibacillus sp. UNC451MF]|uniref:ABC transporter substrate-binding protein n=1 Tax=Paenibacillus sp. UNC451MF TaxID=1449063 RepID=UPI00048C80C9|nr:ABC transporter substrate-binding protein [Paenibacillus sp. UNC451MF]
MQLIEHYAKLYREWKPEHPQEADVAITVPSIAASLHCTERNAKLIIKAMCSIGWISWQPGSGRGHSSRLRFLADIDRLLLDQAENLIRSGNMQEAVKLLQSPLLTEQGQERLRYAISQAFGFHTHKGDMECRHLLRFPSYRQPGMLDPIYTTRRTELHLVRQLFDTLVVYDPERNVFAPGLAHHWEVDDEARSWRFYLQKQVRFHNGVPCTAEDVKASLERLTRNGAHPSPYRILYETIQGVETFHEHLLEIRCQQSCRHLLSLLAATAASIIPRQPGPDWPFKVEGTGPFKLVKRDDSVLVLDANPDHFMRASQLDRVEMWYLPEMYEERQGTLLTKEAELTKDESCRCRQEPLLKQDGRTTRRQPLREDEQESGGMNFRHFGGIGPERSEGNWATVERHDLGCKYILLQLAKPGPLQQPELRDALFEVIRNKEEVAGLGGNRGELATTFVRKEGMPQVPSSTWRDASPHGQSTRCAVAYSERSCKLQLLTYAGAGNERDADWLKRTLTGIGVALEVRFVPYEELSLNSVLAEADLILLEQPVDGDAEWAMWAILGSEQSPLRQCLPGETLQRLDSRMAALTNELSSSRRLQQLLLLEEELLANRSMILWYRWRQAASFPAELQGVKISPFGWVDYKDLWFRDISGDSNVSMRLFPT